MSSELGLRLLGMVIMALMGARLGVDLQLPSLPRDISVLLFALTGSLFGLILTPYFTSRPARSAQRFIRETPAEGLLTALFGLIIGLIIAALFSIPLSLLPTPFREWSPIVIAISAAYLGVTLFSYRAADVVQVLRQFSHTGGYQQATLIPAYDVEILLDTSVIIDGRILDIAQTGFIFGRLLIPAIVLRELQHIADDSEPLRRNRGKRGLEILEQLKANSQAPVEILDDEAEDNRLVDDRLVSLAKQRGAYLMTTDHNLNRTASLQGVHVLNINELAKAVRAVLLPNEVIALKVTGEGREMSQGVGYLDDGTMVVVEDGKRYLDRTIYVVITRMLQTNAGKMYFARPEDRK